MTGLVLALSLYVTFRAEVLAVQREYEIVSPFPPLQVLTCEHSTLASTSIEILLIV